MVNIILAALVPKSAHSSCIRYFQLECYCFSSFDLNVANAFVCVIRTEISNHLDMQCTYLARQTGFVVHQVQHNNTFNLQT